MNKSKTIQTNSQKFNFLNSEEAHFHEMIVKSNQKQIGEIFLRPSSQQFQTLLLLKKVSR
jgi:hypothetical protein